MLAGDAAGVVAPASGEGIYYAMPGGRLAADAADSFLASGDAERAAPARKRFMQAHGRVFWILGMMQWFWYANDKRRERFVSICRDSDVQQLTWEAYMNKELVRARPAGARAHLLQGPGSSARRGAGMSSLRRPPLEADPESPRCRLRGGGSGRVDDRYRALVRGPAQAGMAAAGLAVRAGLDS